MTELKHYQCIKKVHARPMTLGEFEQHTGHVIPSTLGRDAEGFLVVYAKDTENEYHSWSPKQAFDEGYVELEEGATH